MLRNYEESSSYLGGIAPVLTVDKQRRLTRVPLFETLGLRLERLGKAYAKLSIGASGDFTQPGGMLQGGVLAALVEAAARQALGTMLPAGHDGVTIHLDTRHARLLQDGRLFAEAAVVRKSPNLAHVEVTVADAAGTLLARGWCVFRLTRREPEFPRQQPDVAPLGPDWMEGGLGI